MPRFAPVCICPARGAAADACVSCRAGVMITRLPGLFGACGLARRRLPPPWLLACAHAYAPPSRMARAHKRACRSIESAPPQAPVPTTARTSRSNSPKACRCASARCPALVSGAGWPRRVVSSAQRDQMRLPECNSRRGQQPAGAAPASSLRCSGGQESRSNAMRGRRDSSTCHACVA